MLNEIQAKEIHYQTLIENHKSLLNDISASKSFKDLAYTLGVANLTAEKNRINVQIDHLAENKLSKVDFDIETNKIKNEYKMNLNRTYSLELEIKATDNYIEKHVPYTITEMIGEALDYILTRKADRDRIREYMKYRIKELKNVITEDNGWSNLEKKRLAKLPPQEVFSPLALQPQTPHAKTAGVKQNLDAKSKRSTKNNALHTPKSKKGQGLKSRKVSSSSNVSGAKSKRSSTSSPQNSEDRPKSSLSKTSKKSAKNAKRHSLQPQALLSRIGSENPAQMLNRVIECEDEELESPTHKQFSGERERRITEIIKVNRLESPKDAATPSPIAVAKAKTFRIAIDNYPRIIEKVRLLTHTNFCFIISNVKF